MKQLRLGALLFLFSIFGTLFAEESLPLPDGPYCEIETPRGVLTVELFAARAPLTVTNFVGLAEGTLNPKKGVPFFDGLTFHRVVPGFVIQGGDPLGTGEGGPGYTFPDEFSPGLRHDRVGVLSMANDGPDTNGSQFFFTLAPVNRLNYLHSVFGQVVRGLDVLPRIRTGDTMRVKIVRVGTVAQGFQTNLAAFRQRMEKQRGSKGLAEAPAPHFEDQAKVLPTDPPRAKTFNLKLANFERFTGRKIYARLYQRFVPRDPAQKLEDYAQALAKELGLERKGALALFFTDKQEWYLWLGYDDMAALKSKEATATWIERRKRFYDAVEKAASETIAAASQADSALTEANKVKMKVDAFLDGLISSFEAGELGGLASS